MSLSLPFGPGSSVNASSATESTYPSFDPPSQWQFNRTDQTADPSRYPRQEELQVTSGYGAYVHPM